jgi:hypothetical protein
LPTGLEKLTAFVELEFPDGFASGARPQVQNQGATYQSEAQARRDKSNQHGGSEDRKNSE